MKTRIISLLLALLLLAVFPVPAYAAEYTISNGTNTAVIFYNVERELISSVTSLMEYSLNGVSWSRITGTTLDVSKIIPSATAASDVTLRIRFRADGSTPTSVPETANITLAKRPAAPRSVEVKFDGATESITGVTAAMEYRAGGVGAFTLATTTTIPVELKSTQQTYQFRIAATSTTPASTILSVAVFARAAAPNAVYNGANDSITGVSKAVEFSLDGGATWKPCPGVTIPRSEFGSAATVRVRTAATANRAFSAYKDVVIGQATPKSTAIKYNGLLDAITGVTPLMEYRIGTTGVFEDVTGITIPIEAKTTPQTVQIRSAQTDTAAASAVLNVTVFARAAAPNAVYNGNTDSITGVSRLREFSFDGITWTTCEATTIARSEFDGQTEVQVRTAATETRPSSLIRYVTIGQPTPKASVIKYNGLLEEITGVSLDMEYRIGTSGDFTAVTGSTIPIPAERVPQIVQVRTAATVASPTSPPSAPLNITVFARLSAPNAVYNGTNDSITGVLKTMEFSLDGDLWERCEGNSIPRVKFDGAPTVQVRTAATDTRPSSLIKTVTIGQPTPKSSAVRYNGLIDAITGVDDTMEYRIGPAGTFIPITDTTLPIMAGTTQQTVQIRTAQTDTALASAILNVTVFARAAAPNAVYNGTNDTISGVSSTREFSLDGGITWEKCVSTTIPRIKFDGTSVVQVRTAATETRPSSQIKHVVISQPTPKAANIKYNGLLDAITGVSANMEYRIGSTGDFIPVTGPTIPILAGNSIQTVQIRASATSVETASAPLSVTVFARAAAPNAIYNGNTDNITGVSRLMEYSFNGTIWYECFGASIPRDLFDGNPVVQVRVAATLTRPSSHIKTIIVGQPTPKSEFIKFNGFTETVDGVDDSMEYRFGTTGDFIKVTGTSIPANPGTSFQTLQIRVAATATAPASATLNMSIGARLPAPNASYYPLGDTIINVTMLMEYSLNNGVTWLPCTGVIIMRSEYTDAPVVLVRTAAIASRAASYIRTIEIP